MKICEKCGQEIPPDGRPRDSLPPLEFPALVTIHDLPAGTQPKVTLDRTGGVHLYRLAE